MYKPKKILEIGTFVGRTLFFMINALEKNGDNYQIHTIDISSNLKIEDKYLKNCIIHNGWSSDILESLCDLTFDFIFNDAEIDIKTAKILENKFINENTIFATHDFVPPIDKGISSVYNMLNYTRLNNNYLIMPEFYSNWIYATKSNLSYHDSFTENYLKQISNISNASICHKNNINACIALILPKYCIEQIPNSDNYKKLSEYLLQENNILSNTIKLKFPNENFSVLFTIINFLPYICGFIKHD
jgi:hypothetical protein